MLMVLLIITQPADASWELVEFDCANADFPDVRAMIRDGQRRHRKSNQLYYPDHIEFQVKLYAKSLREAVEYYEEMKSVKNAKSSKSKVKVPNYATVGYTFLLSYFRSDNYHLIESLIGARQNRFIDIESASFADGTFDTVRTWPLVPRNVIPILNARLSGIESDSSKLFASIEDLEEKIAFLKKTEGRDSYWDVDHGEQPIVDWAQAYIRHENALLQFHTARLLAQAREEDWRGAGKYSDAELIRTLYDGALERLAPDCTPRLRAYVQALALEAEGVEGLADAEAVKGVINAALETVDAVPPLVSPRIACGIRKATASLLRAAQARFPDAFAWAPAYAEHLHATANCERFT